LSLQALRHLFPSAVAVAKAGGTNNRDVIFFFHRGEL